MVRCGDPGNQAHRRLANVNEAIGDLLPAAEWSGRLEGAKLVLAPQTALAGIGAAVDPDAKDGSLRIANVAPNGPAAQAGLTVGHVIIKVDGEPATMRAVRGRAGTTVRLTILSAGKEREMTLTRQTLAAGRQTFELRSRGELVQTFGTTSGEHANQSAEVLFTAEP